MLSAGQVFDLLKTTWHEFGEDKVMRLSAAMAYYTIFSLAPLLVIVIAIAGIVFGEEAARGQIVGSIQGLIGQEGAEGIQAMIQGASREQTGSMAATLLGFGTLLLGAAGVFGALQESLNTIWEVEPKPGAGILGMVRQRFLSFTMVFGTGFLLLVSLIISAALAAAGKYMENALPGGATLWQVINFIVSFGVITLLFALIFKYIPDTDITWKDVMIGAAITALLFTIGRFAIGMYIGRSSTASTFGAAGSLVIILLWVYYSAVILFLGAEFTQVYANTYGSKVVPDADAVPLSEQARIKQGIPRREDVEEAAATDKSVERTAREREQRGADARQPAPPSETRGERRDRQPLAAPAATRLAASPGDNSADEGFLKRALKNAGYTILGLALIRGLRAIGNSTTTEPPQPNNRR